MNWTEKNAAGVKLTLPAAKFEEIFAMNPTKEQWPWQEL